MTKRIKLIFNSNSTHRWFNKWNVATLFELSINDVLMKNIKLGLVDELASILNNDANNNKLQLHLYEPKMLGHLQRIVWTCTTIYFQLVCPFNNYVKHSQPFNNASLD